MKIEILFPEVCNLYGDLQNVYYMQRCCHELEIVETDLHTRPAFLDGGIALVFMGSTTEQGLQLAAEALRPYREAIAERVDAGQLFLATGNALDILGEFIESDTAPRIEGLGLLSTHAEYHMMQRHNSYYVGTFEGMDIVGFKSLFGHSHGTGEPLFTTVKGVGRDGQERSGEGFRRGGLMATYLIGPLLILNPPLCKWLLRQMGAPTDTLAFEEAAMDSYQKRVAEFMEPDRSWKY